MSIYIELYKDILRLEWRVSPEPLRLNAPPHWANLTWRIFWWWEKNEAPRGNPHKHKENMLHIERPNLLMLDEQTWIRIQDLLAVRQQCQPHNHAVAFKKHSEPEYAETLPSIFDFLLIVAPHADSNRLLW